MAIIDCFIVSEKIHFISNKYMELIPNIYTMFKYDIDNPSFMVFLNFNLLKDFIKSSLIFVRLIN